MTALELASALREVTGFEEEWTARQPGGRPGVFRACNGLLARCLADPGERCSAQLDAVRKLTLSERDWLLVELRRRTLGTRIQSQMRCPACEYASEVVFSTHDLPVRPEAPPRRIEVVLPGGAPVVVRPLTAGDHEELSAGEARDEAGMVEQVLARTVLLPESALSELSAEDRAALAKIVDETSPEALQAELECGRCGQALLAPLDFAAFFIAELQEHARTLLDDVHTLARAYHWSEREILSLPLGRRLEYLSRIEAELDAALVATEGWVR